MNNVWICLKQKFTSWENYSTFSDTEAYSELLQTSDIKRLAKMNIIVKLFILASPLICFTGCWIYLVLEYAKFTQGYGYA